MVSSLEPAWERLETVEQNPVKALCEDAEEEHEDIGHAESETAVAKPPCGGIVWTYRQWVQVGQRRRKIVGLFDILCHWV
jgi:hypothetical protein